MKISLFKTNKKRDHSSKSIFIHVGPDKTGTSAIQFWCMRNRAALSKQGVDYPAHNVDQNGISSGHNSLFLDKEKCFSGYKVLPIIEKFYRSDHNMLILSSENLWRFLPDIQALIPEAKFIFYLRLGADYQMSSYHQAVKRHNKTIPFRLNDHQHRIFQLKMDQIDLDRVHFRYYHPELFENNCVENDFLSFLKIKHKTVKNTRINTSLHFDALEFKRFMNHFNLPIAIDKRLDIILQTYQPSDQCYSLITEKAYQTNNQKTQSEFLAMAKAFKLDIEHTESYFRLLNNKQIPKYQPQILTYPTFSRCMSYIESKDTDLKLTLMRFINEPNKTIELPRTYSALKADLPNLVCMPFNNHYKIPTYRKLSTFLVEFYGNEGMENKLAIDLISCKDKAVFKLEQLPKKLIEQLSKPYKNKIVNPDILRDLGLIIESIDIPLAFSLMTHAASLRPNGSFILEKKQQYQNVILEL